MIYNQQRTQMKLTKKIHATLHCGRLQSQEIHHGQLRGVQDDLDGTSNVLQWRINI
jgi:hypothetical protein